MATKKRSHENGGDDDDNACTCCIRPLYLLVAVLQVRPTSNQISVIEDCAERLRKIHGDPLLASFLESKLSSSSGTCGVKIGAYTTLDKAEEAAKHLEDRIRKFGGINGSPHPSQFHEFLILRFNADVSSRNVEVTWNGDPVRIGETKYDNNSNWLEVKWRYRRAADTHKCGEMKNKRRQHAPTTAYLVVKEISYHGTTRLMELALLNNKKRAEYIAQRVMDYERLQDETQWQKRDVAKPIGVLELALDDMLESIDNPQELMRRLCYNNHVTAMIRV